MEYIIELIAQATPKERQLIVAFVLALLRKPQEKTKRDDLNQ